MENIMNMVILTACSHPASHKPGRFTLSTPCHPQLLNQSTDTREEKPQSWRTPDRLENNGFFKRYSAF